MVPALSSIIRIRLPVPLCSANVSGGTKPAYDIIVLSSRDPLADTAHLSRTAYYETLLSSKLHACARGCTDYVQDGHALLLNC